LEKYIVTSQDYPPYGSALPGLQYNYADDGDTSRYRFGFNTQERDDEIAGEGNIYTAEFWEYDARLGRRWNLDPIVISYLSSYLCFKNSPIFYKDVIGLSSSPYLTPEDPVIKCITWEELNSSIKLRVNWPYLVNQETTNTCGIVAIEYIFITNHSWDFWYFMNDLYNDGKSKLPDGTEITLDPIFKNNKVELPQKMDMVDFIFIKSVAHTYGTESIQAGLVVSLLKTLNFKDVVDNSSYIFNGGTFEKKSDLKDYLFDLEKKYTEGFNLVMSINDNMLYSSRQAESSLISNHWVVYSGNLNIEENTTNPEESIVKFDVFTYGERKNVTIKLKDFYNNYYGYIEAKK
jgi:hypothetical protein